MNAPASLPDDPELLKDLLLAERAESERLRQIIKELQRHRFGPRAESLPVDQLLLGLEEVEQVEAAAEAKDEAARPAEREAHAARRRANRGSLPAHLPRIERIVDLESRTCPCCSGSLHRIGEDVAERLDVVPAAFRVLVVRRPKYACRTCEDVVVQAPAPARLIEGGLPTEATVAHVLVSKYADHLPLYRQAQIYARQGVALDRSTLADWVGRAAFLLRPVHERLLAILKTSTKLFADETTAPVLDPGRGRTKTGQLWTYARDDRPWGGTDPPGVAYIYAPDRKAERPIEHLAGFGGILQTDGYEGYRKLAKHGDVRLAFCWSHVRRRFVELARAGPAPIATEALERIAALYRIETEIRGCSPARQKVYPVDVTLVFPVSGRGRPRKNHVPDAKSVSAEKTLEAAPWRTLSWRRGTKGPLKARFAAMRIKVADGPPQRIGDMGQQHLPGEEAWLIGEHRSSGERKYYLSNLPADTSLKRLAGAIKARWICEQAHQQLKEELGLDHFEGRSWTGLHRHALMTMIAYAFLQSRRLKQAKREKKNPGPATSADPASGPRGHHRQARTATANTMPALSTTAQS